MMLLLSKRLRCAPTANKRDEGARIDAERTGAGRQTDKQASEVWRGKKTRRRVRVVASGDAEVVDAVAVAVAVELQLRSCSPGQG